MSLWGNNDNVTSAGKITAIDYDAKTVTGSGTAWGAAGSAQVGDVLRIGVRGPGVAATYFGDAVIVAVASSESITIASTVGLSQVGFTTSARFSTCTKSPILDTVYQEKGVTDRDSVVYGISTAISGSYHVPHQGWVGVTTYVDMHGTLRVKSEVLVAMSGIDTNKSTIGNTPSLSYPTTDRNS